MNFKYQAITSNGEKREGMIEAVNRDLAVREPQRQELIVAVSGRKEQKKWFEVSVL